MTETEKDCAGMRNIAVISLGSNVRGQRRKNIIEASERLMELIGAAKLAESLIHPTAPLNPRHRPYLNYVVAIETSPVCDCLSCERLCKQLEKEAGRTPRSKECGEMPLDVDLLYWNRRMIRPCAVPLPYLVSALSEVILGLKARRENICGKVERRF